MSTKNNVRAIRPATLQQVKNHAKDPHKAIKMGRGILICVADGQGGLTVLVATDSIAKARYIRRQLRTILRSVFNSKPRFRFIRASKAGSIAAS